jgi:serine/threonine-protein kinase
VLKPANILINDGRAHLAEFGVTGRSVGQVGLATPNCQLPTAQYLAPEQILGAEPDHRADIYSLAVLVFELATSTSLYDGAQPSAILRTALNGAPPSAHARRPDVPRDVDGVLRRALSRDPQRRHESVWELMEDLVCPPQLNGANRRSGSAAEPDSARGAVTIDSLIDVLSVVLTPEGEPS